MACGCKTRMHDCYVFYALCACHVNGRHCAHHHFAVHGCRWGGSFVLGLGVFLGLEFLLGLGFLLGLAFRMGSLTLGVLPAAQLPRRQG